MATSLQDEYFGHRASYLCRHRHTDLLVPEEAPVVSATKLLLLQNTNGDPSTEGYTGQEKVTKEWLFLQKSIILEYG